MVKRLVLVALVLIIAILPLGIASADEPAPGSPEDNACNAGGVMAGKCVTDWDWIGGWYLARFLSGVFKGIPDGFASLLPRQVGEDGQPIETVTLLCIFDPVATQHDMLVGTLDTFENGVATISKDGTCTGIVNYVRTIVAAPDMVQAVLLFESIAGLPAGSGTCTNLAGKGYTGVPMDWWECL